MTMAILRPEHAFARDLDLSDPRDVAKAVAIYADVHGRTLDRYHFDEAQAANAILFFPRYARLTKGSNFAGRPFVLSPWQAFDIIAPAWGWRCEDGTRRYRRCSVWVPRKNGKALALDTPIPTPSGWTAMGALTVGDQVFDERGHPCRVTFVTPVQRDRQCFRVTFSDGTSIVADADHRWVAKPKEGKPRVVTTTEMAARLHVGNRPGVVERNWSIDVAAPIHCPEAKLPIDPYVLGVWLGDGHKGDARVTIAADSPEVKANIEAAGYTVNMVPSSASQESSPTYWLSEGPRSKSDAVICRLRIMGLIGCKHIPIAYLRSSIHQRTRLLQGIVDTDGHVEGNGQIEIVTVIDRLRDDILDLVRGLGMKAQFSTDRALLAGRDMGPRHRIRFYAYADTPVATVARKYAAQKQRPLKPSRNAIVKVVAIDPVESVPVRCIEVDSPSHLYLAGPGMTPTHNTELMAGTALAHLFCDGEIGGEGYAVATKEDQARIVFDAAKRMVLMNPALSGAATVFKDAIYCPELFSAFKPLGGKAEGSHGKGPSFRIADELHEFRDDRLLQFLDQGTGARAQPMAWDISTAGLQEGYGWELFNVCRNLVDGTIEDHRTLVAIYGADDEDDPYAEATWIKANPNYGVSLSPEYMRDQAELAKRSTRHENDFKRYHLNLWVGQVKRWLKIERWDACAPDADWKEKRERFRGRTAWLGVDLSATQDLASVAAVFPPAGSDPNWQVIQRTFLPDADLMDRIRDSRVSFDRWAELGAITLTPGDAADHDAIERQIREDFEAYDVKGAGFDPWNAHAMMTSLKADFGDDRIIKVSQTIAGMNSGCKLLERLVLTGRLDHGRDPVLRWCANNVEIAQDGNGNIKPMKRKGHQKIDPLVAVINGLAVSQGEEPENNVPSLEVYTL